MGDKIYNEELKERYLKEKFDNEGSKTTVRYIFKKSELIEDTLQKDLYDFNIQEIAKVLQNANPYSNAVSKAYARAISGYISWAISPMGLREDNMNPIKSQTPDWPEQFVDKTKKIHFSYDELTQMVEGFYNAQDQALVWLLFEGAQGYQFSEIRHLNYENVEWTDNILNLYDENYNRRELEVSNQCMRYITNAYKQTEYMGETETVRELIKSDFIIRNVVAPKTKTPDASLSAIYNRIYSLKKKLELEYFTPNGVKQSGMLWYAYNIYKRDGKFGDYEQFAEIGRRFNSSKLTNNGLTYFNTNNMREFINPEKLKELYDVDVEF